MITQRQTTTGDILDKFIPVLSAKDDPHSIEE